MKTFLTTSAMAALLALSVGTYSDALADIYWTESLPDGGHVTHVYDDDHNWKSSHFYDEDNKHVLSVNPDPTDGSSGDGGDIDDMIEGFLKGKGGSLEAEVDFWQTRIGLEMIQKGLGYVPVHNPAQIDDIADSVINEGQDFDGGGGSGFDPLGRNIAEHLKKKGSSGSDDDDNDGSSSSTPQSAGEEMPGPAPLVNPVPDGPHTISAVLGARPTGGATPQVPTAMRTR